MKKYPLGFAIIEWKSGGHSKAVIYEDALGNQCLQCANHLAPINYIPHLIYFEKEIENIITDFYDIAEFYGAE
ncbi:hypothetical protein KNT87_gp288 [Erwinia phage Cronus]|uniref:Uncharacterized protein n=1 Tax=Erwinia phage Cronus TaxID=2163633 RepID=A0A2S1GMF6_9CAUD|nr:hypothetical protein KNT87_gp288 [Erwinia phage Cronus]AWD90572.1 hypothetical protein [Erwinia phage Cronus]